MEFQGTGYSQIGAENPYKYSSKEKQADFNLNWFDFGARMYNPEIGRWNSVDPLANNFLICTPYNYCANNPIKFKDPDGRTIYLFYNDKEEQIQVLSDLAKIFSTSYGERIINTLNASNSNRSTYIDDPTFFDMCTFETSKYDPPTRKLTYNADDPEVAGLGHELQHAFDHNNGGLPIGKYQGFKEPYEKTAVRTENYLLAIFKEGELKDGYKFSMFDKIAGNSDFKCSTDPLEYTNGESVSFTETKKLSDPKESGLFTFSINKYSADAPEITKAKTGMIFYYDYKENKDSEVKKMAIKIDY